MRAVSIPRLLLSVLLIAPTLMSATQISAAPVADDERVPIDLRRTTLVVRDIDESLALYRDALGMKVIYDNVIRRPVDAPDTESASYESRLVFLRANDDYIGVLGLLEYRKPAKKPANQGLEPFTPGSSVLLFNSENLDEVFSKAAGTLGVKVLSRPSVVEYPGYGGDGVIRVNVSVIVDPDGFVIELNQVLSGMPGE